MFLGPLGAGGNIARSVSELQNPVHVELALVRACLGFSEKTSSPPLLCQIKQMIYDIG